MKKIRTSILVFLTHKIGLPYFKLFRKPINFPFTIQELAHFNKESIGYKLYQFLTHNNLALLPYYERHDIKHVVLNYPPTEVGEVSLQCFMLANGRITFPIILTVLFGCCTMPEYYATFLKAFKRGYACPSLHNVDWILLLNENLTTIQYNLLNKN